MPARTFINIWMLPLIQRYGIQILMPLRRRITRFYHQVVEAVLSLGKMAVINLEQLERGFKTTKLGLRGLDFGFFTLANHLWQNQPRQDGKDRQNEHHFNEGERVPVLTLDSMLSGGFTFHK